MKPSYSLNVAIFLNHSEIIAHGWGGGGGAEVGGCSSVRMSELKSFQRTSFWLVGSLCGFLSITFELSCWPAPVSNLHQRRTRHSCSSRKDTEIYRVCLRTRGQAGGLRLSALLGEAADLAAAAATGSTARLYVYHPPLPESSGPSETQTLTWPLHTFSFM